MAKLENYVELARQTMREISADGENWHAFLTTASNVYKYVHATHHLQLAWRHLEQGVLLVVVL